MKNNICIVLKSSLNLTIITTSRILILKFEYVFKDKENLSIDFNTLNLKQPNHFDSFLSTNQLNNSTIKTNPLTNIRFI